MEIRNKMLTLGAGITIPSIRQTATEVARAVVPNQVSHQHAGQMFLVKGNTCQFCQFSREVG